MLKIRILCVGKIKEKFFREAIDEYLKRLKAKVKMEIIEVADESTQQIELAKKTEGERLFSKISEQDYVIALAIDGKSFNSEDLASFINEKMVTGHSSLTFVIGGSAGLSDSILKRANYLLSFSKFTFPHQLMRVILLEQIYRSFKIIHGEPYHK